MKLRCKHIKVSEIKKADVETEMNRLIQNLNNNIRNLGKHKQGSYMHDKVSQRVMEYEEDIALFVEKFDITYIDKEIVK